MFVIYKDDIYFEKINRHLYPSFAWEGALIFRSMWIGFQIEDPLC